MRLFASFALAAGLALAALPAAAEDVTDAARHRTLVQTLTGYEREAWATYARRDVVNAPARLAADYSDLQADGTVLDRAGHVAFVPDADLASWTLDQFRVFRLSPDVALVTYRARSRENTATGPGPESVAWITSGWARRGGRWLNVFYRETSAGE